MSAYILRTIPEPLWTHVKTKAKEEGMPLRVLILALLEAYAAGKIRVAPNSPTVRIGE